MIVHLSLFANTIVYLKVQFIAKNSFIAIEIYICMTSMMMLEITMEVSENIGLPLKSRAQAWLGLALTQSLGHTWAL